MSKPEIKGKQDIEKKPKKIGLFICICIIPIIIIILVIILMCKLKIREDWLIKIEDVSMNCMTNQIYLYDDGEYIVRNNEDIIKRGNIKSSYVHMLIDAADSYEESDMNMNYMITFKDGNSIYVDKNKSPELESLIKTISFKDLFACID